MSATTTNSPPAKGEYPAGGRGFMLPQKTKAPKMGLYVLS